MIPVADPDIQNPLKDLIQEITRQYITQITKESTKQAIRKQGVKLSQSQFHKLEEKISSLTDKQKLEAMKEPLNEVKETLTTQEMGEKTIDKLSDCISHGFEMKLAVGMALGVKAAIISVLLIIGILSTTFFILPGLDENLAVITPGTNIGDDANSNRQICPVCNGKITMTCTMCGGSGEIDCENCGGDGIYNPPDGMCTVCDGTGKVKCPGNQPGCNNGHYNCVYCNGDGYFDPGDGTME